MVKRTKVGVHRIFSSERGNVLEQRSDSFPKTGPDFLKFNAKNRLLASTRSHGQIFDCRSFYAASRSHGKSQISAAEKDIRNPYERK